MTHFMPDQAATIRAGRANVRLIDAADVLIELEKHDESREELQRVQRRYREGLRQLVAVLPTDVTAQIMAASEKVLGTVQDVGLN